MLCYAELSKEMFLNELEQNTTEQDLSLAEKGIWHSAYQEMHCSVLLAAMSVINQQEQYPGETTSTLEMKQKLYNLLLSYRL